MNINTNKIKMQDTIPTLQLHFLRSFSFNPLIPSLIPTIVKIIARMPKPPAMPIETPSDVKAIHTVPTTIAKDKKANTQDFIPK